MYNFINLFKNIYDILESCNAIIINYNSPTFHAIFLNHDRADPILYHGVYYNKQNISIILSSQPLKVQSRPNYV